MEAWLDEGCGTAAVCAVQSGVQGRGQGQTGGRVHTWASAKILVTATEQYHVGKGTENSREVRCAKRCAAPVGFF